MQQTLPPDPIALTNRFNELSRKGEKEELSLDELKELIETTRNLRRTNTGPAKVKAAGKRKGPLSDNELDDLLA